MRPSIRFLHVPKAAGSSVADAIRAAAIADGAASDSPPTICPEVMDATLFGTFDRWDELTPERAAMIALVPERIAAHDIVLGHFGLDHLAAGHRTSDVVTVLREPRSRLLSLYTYWRSWSEEEHASWAPYDASRAAARPLAEMLVDPTVAAQTDNVVARMLLGDHPDIPPAGFIAAADVEQLTEQAVERLVSLGHVDLVEEGDACWARLAAWAELDLRVDHRNATPAGPTLPRRELDAAAAALAGRVAIDRQLWAAAAQRLDPTANEQRLRRRADDVYRRRTEQLSRSRRIVGGWRRGSRRRDVR